MYTELDEREEKIVNNPPEEKDEPKRRVNKAIRLALGETEWNRSVIVMKGDFKAIDMRDIDYFEDSPSDLETESKTRSKPKSWYRPEWCQECTLDERRILNELKIEYDQLLTKLSTKSLTKLLNHTEQLLLTREKQSEMFTKSLTMLKEDLVKGLEYSKKYPRRRMRCTPYLLCAGSYEIIRVTLILSAVILYCRVFYYLMFQWQT